MKNTIFGRCGLHKDHHFRWRLRSTLFVLFPAVIARCSKTDTLLRQKQRQRKIYDKWCMAWTLTQPIIEYMSERGLWQGRFFFFPFLIREHRRLWTASDWRHYNFITIFNQIFLAFLGEVEVHEQQLVIGKKKTTTERRSMVRSYTTRDVVSIHLRHSYRRK